MENLFRKAFEFRGFLHNSTENTCYRIFNSGSDGIPGLTIDRYGEYILVQFYDEAIVDSKDGLLRAELASEIADAVECLPFNVKGVVLKNRIMYVDIPDYSDVRTSQLLQGELPPGDYGVRQNGLEVCVDIVNGQSTGVFLDMREVRDFLGSFYREKGVRRMLNLFCYTGLFSVHALASGVASAVNVDLSRSVLTRARKNYELNGLRADDRDFIYGDANEWIRRLKKQGRVFDFVVIDPPTFARHRSKSFSVKRDMADSINNLSHLAPGGYVLSAVNTKNVDEAEYLSYHPAGWELVRFFRESTDYIPEKENYLKCGIWQVKE